MGAGGRVLLITGATEGAGRQIAADLAANRDNHVIIHGRSREKCERAQEWIRNQCGRNIDFIIADFASLKKVSDMAEEVQRRFPNLDTLICNASVICARRQESIDGFEMSLQVNFLSHFVLVNKLLPLLESNGPARIVIVGSVLHSWISLDWSDMQAERVFEKYLQFSRSKLALHQFAFALHRRMNIAKQPVSVNVIELSKEKEPNNNLKFRSATALSSSESTLSMGRAAGNLVEFIESRVYDRLSGKYLDSHGKQIRSGADATDERQQERLWTWTQELVQGFL